MTLSHEVLITSLPLKIEDAINNLVPLSPGMNFALFTATPLDSTRIRTLTENQSDNLQTHLKNICKDLHSSREQISKIVIYLRYGSFEPSQITIIVALMGTSDLENILTDTVKMIKAKIKIFATHPNHLNKQIDPIAPEVDPSIYLNTDLVQVKAYNEELDRRIEALQRHKRANVDSANIHEFIVDGGGKRCARVSAPLRRRTADMPGHLLIRRVCNESGPQIFSNPNVKAHNGINQRFVDVEDKLGIPPPPIPSDIYQRIRYVEDRLLALEACSPEYFSGKILQVNKYENIRNSELKKVYSTADIDKKIFDLEKLLFHQKNN